MISNHEFLNRLCRRSAAAVIAQSGVRHPALLSHLRRTLTAPPGEPGSFLAEPVIEAAFGWREAQETMADLTGLLDPALIDALDKDTPSDPQRSDRYRFARSWHPYTHQVETWRTLLGAEPRSTLVTSGTGSGKTECFLIPILQDLVRMRATAGQISGVRALMLYPLNALINSQRDRLFDWTEPFGSDIRFCLYNGATPHEISSATARVTPNEVRDRATLRANPPPILVTNITMLEYMLIRAEDQPILARSRGKLRWIVLDEAHSYVGSQAAELALLLRRVMRAFDVDPGEVRVVATSATIGEGADVDTSLAKFLGDISNMGPMRISVIKGQRETKEPADLTPVKDVLDGHFEAARRLRQALAGTQGIKLRSAAEVAFGTHSGNEPILELVERTAHAASAGVHYLPVRLHLVHRAQPGIWVCPSKECSGRSGTPLDKADWPFGAVQVLEHQTCPHCHSVLFELVVCQECGEPHLAAEETVEGNLRPPVSLETDDEFAEGVDYEIPDETADTTVLRTHFIAMATAGGEARSVPFDPRTGRLLDELEPGSILLRLAPGHTCTGCGVQRDRGAGIRPVRFGAPFLLGGVLPQMLERADASKLDLPGEGRQLITFTDSRQGTARFAARLQQDSERNLVRAVLYHAVQSSAGSEQDRRRIEDLKKDLAQLEALPENVRSGIAEIIAGKRRDLKALEETSGTSLPWTEAMSRLASEAALETLREEVWQYRDPKFADPLALSRIMLLREFSRRPRRANSAETLGLVALRYPVFEKLIERQVPEPFARHGGSLDDWKSFLYALETLTLRGRGAVDVAVDDLPWLGPKIPLRVVLAPENRDDADRWRLAWPNAGRGSRSTSIPVKMLAHVLKLDFDRPDHADHGNAILAAGFRALQPLLKEVQGGWRLDLSRADIVRVEKAWLCPVTFQVLPWTIRGITPWQPLGSKVETEACPDIRMPRLPQTFPRTEGSRAGVDRWLDENPDVATMREKGIWTDLHDRIARFSPLVLAAEHSAQQPGWKLRWFERRFREGRLNVLSCSTTMEMGVDIGGLQTVVNTNVPPSPANYRQRVGRAGRRREAISTALTFAKDEPLGWTTYTDPLTPLKAEIRAPGVSLQSSVIVQRHVNALLLGEFIQTVGSDELHKLSAGAFFGRNEKGGKAPDALSARFIAWCRSLDQNDTTLRRDLAALVRGTCLEAVPNLRERTAARCEHVADDWRREWESLSADLSQSDTAANRRISIQLQRLCGAALLGELGDRGFLPSHGFPTDVLPFLVPDRKDGRRERDSDGREFGKRLEVPSRSLNLAIRDYAPGTEVVLDGLVYRSAGVTLNWKRPADENSREIQNLRFAWRCDECDASGDAPQQPAQCPDCGSESLRRVEYLRPAGFTFDEAGRDRPHTDVTRIDYAEPTPPFVSASGAEWLALPHPEAGRMRAAPAGSILYRADGLHRAGFGLCLHCGRADAELRTPQDGVLPPLPRALENHRPLRAKGGAELCPGNHAPFGIKRNLTLGHFARTDVFELQLEALAKNSLEKAATSIAVAVRESLARRLGVESSEIGYSAAKRRRGSGRSGWSILLFDQAPGGAGYATQAAELVAPLLRDAALHLDCKADGCVRYCPACILTADSRFEEDKLNRQEGLEVLRAVLPLMELPDRFRVVDDAVAESRGVLDAIRLGLVSGPVIIFFGGDVDEWDPSAWSGRRLLDRLTAAGIPVRLAAPRATLGRLATGQRLGLYGLASRDGVTLHEMEEPPLRGGLPLLAAAGTGSNVILWLIDEISATSPGTDWGRSVEAPLVRGSGAIPEIGPAIDPARLSPPLGENVRRLLVDRQLDGGVRDFGSRFWSILEQADPDLRRLWSRGVPATVTYTDRYLFSPLPLHLLLQVLGSVPGGLSGTKIDIHSQNGTGSSDRTPQGLLDNWPSERVRGGVMRAMLRQAGLDVTVYLRPRNELSHDRLLSMTWTDGAKLEVTLDQGFGFWRPARMTSFDFTADITEQVARLGRLNYLVEGQKGARTPILIGVKPA